LAPPFINVVDSTNEGQRFPFPFPPHNVSAGNPDNSANWANLIPVSADPFFNLRNRVPYIDNYRPLNLAMIYAGLGKKGEAFDWLNYAYNARSYLLAVYLNTDARLDNLHADPRFSELRSRVGLSDRNKD
jgi:hypothetical protein